MLKRNLERIFTTAAVVLAIILIAVLIVIVFGGIPAKDLDSKLAKGLIMTLGIIYLLLAGASIAFIFMDNEAIKEITLRSNTSQKTRVSLPAVRKMIKNTCAQIEGVKCKGIKLTVSDYGVKLKVSVSVVDKDVEQVEGYIRNLITDVFNKTLGFTFSAIEISIVKFVPSYQPNVQEIIAKSDAELAEKKAEEEGTEAVAEEVAEAPVEEPIQDEVSVEENVEIVPEVESEVVEETSADETIEADVEAEVSENEDK